MRSPKYYIAIVLVNALMLVYGFKAGAQEFNCNVSVSTVAQTEVKNVQAMRSLETSIRDFMNNRRWTEDKFEPNERIQCNIVITLQTINNTDYSGSIQIAASRPVYGMSYTSGTLNFLDKNFTFTYMEFQQMNYQEGSYSSELTAILGFYANVILGFDYDSFSELGGTTYFQRAMSMVNASQSSSAKGWTNMEKTTRNRYFLATQLLDERFGKFRKAFYKYHRQGLDLMYQDNQKALSNVLESLMMLQELNKNFPNSVLVNSFFDAKFRELIYLFSQAQAGQKNKAREILPALDVTNASRYDEALR